MRASAVAVGCFLAASTLMGTTPALAAASPAKVHWRLEAVTITANNPRTYASPAFDASVRRAAADGVTTIDLVATYYQDSLTASTMHPGRATPTMASLRSAARFIRRLGLHLMITVHFEDTAGVWRWFIKPANRREWFAQATSREVALGKLHPWLMVIGVEMGNLSSASENPYDTTGWEKLIAAVHRVDHGALTYDAQFPGGGWSNEAADIGFWSKLNFLGFSGYNNLSAPCGATVASREAAWAKIEKADYAPLEAEFHRPVLFTEVGYRSTRCDDHHPWISLAREPLNLREQAKDYAALMGFWRRIPWFDGVAWWGWRPQPYAGGPHDTSYTPQGKPAEAVLCQAFAGT